MNCSYVYIMLFVSCFSLTGRNKELPKDPHKTSMRWPHKTVISHSAWGIFPVFLYVYYYYYLTMLISCSNCFVLFFNNSILALQTHCEEIRVTNIYVMEQTTGSSFDIWSCVTVQQRNCEPRVENQRAGPYFQEYFCNIESYLINK